MGKRGGGVRTGEIGGRETAVRMREDEKETQLRKGFGN